MQISRVDIHSDAELAAWHAAMEAGARHGRVDPPIWTLPEMKVDFRQSDPGKAWQHEVYAAKVGGEVVGTAMIELPMQDNLNYAELSVTVPPRHRNRGVGSALHVHAMQRIAELGRHSVSGGVNQPIGAARVPGAAFAEKHGFTLRNVELWRRLELPVDAALLDELSARGSADEGGYRLRTWRDACPDDLAEQYAHLKAMLSVDAPLGELNYEKEHWDAARLRAEESASRQQGRVMLTAAAIAPDGSLAGHTQIAVPAHDKPRAYQWDTLVLRTHRGHKLGWALKIANLRILQQEFPDRTRVETWNAEQNDAMNAVNDALGFYSLERSEEWQRDGES